MEHPEKQVRYNDLVDLIEEISKDPRYEKYDYELGLILSMVVKHLERLHQEKRGKDYIESRAKQLGVPSPIESTAKEPKLKSVQEVLRGE